MRPLEIETWALRVVDQVARGAHSEDGLVELKASWPDPSSAARRVAAHANAARGAPILWLIGVDERLGVVGADANELARWHTSLQSHFNHVSPPLQDLNVRVGDRTVVGLVFHTERAPFLVKNPVYGSQGGGPVEWEIPWREGRQTRSANREDIIRLITPLIKLPELEWLDCSLVVYPAKPSDEGTRQRWFLHGSIYVVPSGQEPLAIPFHRCTASIHLPNGSSIQEWRGLTLLPPSSTILTGTRLGLGMKVDSLTVASSSHEIILNGPGKVVLKATPYCEHPLELTPGNVAVTLHMNAVGTNAPCVMSTTLIPAPPSKDVEAAWSMSGKTP